MIQGIYAPLVVLVSHLHSLVFVWCACFVLVSCLFCCFMIFDYFAMLGIIGILEAEKALNWPQPVPGEQWWISWNWLTGKMLRKKRMLLISCNWLKGRALRKKWRLNKLSVQQQQEQEDWKYLHNSCNLYGSWVFILHCLFAVFVVTCLVLLVLFHVLLWCWFSFVQCVSSACIDADIFIYQREEGLLEIQSNWGRSGVFSSCTKLLWRCNNTLQSI